MDIGLPKSVIKCLFWQRGQDSNVEMAVLDRARRGGKENPHRPYADGG